MINLLDMTGYKIIVTGSSSGIGRETAILLSKLGANLILTGRNQKELEKTYSTLEGKNHYIEPINMEKFDDVREWVIQVSRNYGVLNGLVHCAGVQYILPIKITTEDRLLQMVKINLLSSIALVKGFRQKGVASERSSVVLLSSIMGITGSIGLSGYCASKGGLISLTKSLALELANEGIRVNCIAPGVVQTQMTQKAREIWTESGFEDIKKNHPLGIGSALDVANACAFLLSNASKWITGTTLVVDGGYTAK